MRATTLARNSMLILLVIAMAFAGLAVCTQLGLHVYEGNHGATSELVATYFNEDGTCKRNMQGAELFSPSLNRYMYVCILPQANRVAIWITLDRMAHNKVAREITRFICNNAYIKNTVMKFGYELVNGGNLPEWFMQLFGG